MSLFFEFHDARVASVLLEPGRTVISFARLYIFDEADDKGGTFHAAELELGPARISGSFPAEEENDLQTGVLIVGKAQFEGVVPLPLETESPVQLTMNFLWGGQFSLSATGATLRLKRS